MDERLGNAARETTSNTQVRTVELANANRGEGTRMRRYMYVVVFIMRLVLWEFGKFGLYCASRPGSGI